MPTAPVDIEGTELYFTDSGPVPGSNDYTTLVIYHGAAFTGNTFRKLLPFGPADNIRLVIINRRHYFGSTKYTDEEFRDLQEGKEEFISRRGLEVAKFLLWFVDAHKIPQVSADRKSGGFVVMGWSMGNATSLSVLGYPEIIGAKSYQELEIYFRRLILYDPPLKAFGYPDPVSDCNNLSTGNQLTPKVFLEIFGRYLTSYYDHPDFASRSVSGLNFDHGTHPSIENMSIEEVAESFDAEATAATEFPMFLPPMQSELRAMAETCLFDEKRAARILPQLEIVYFVCTKTIWPCALCMFEVEKQYKSHTAQGHKVRPIRFVEIEDANHFVHWDKPKLFWTCVADAVYT